MPKSNRPVGQSESVSPLSHDVSSAEAEDPNHPKRVLGFRDLLLFYVVTGISLRWIAPAGATISVLPPPDEPNKPLAVLKIVGGCGALLVIGMWLYWAEHEERGARVAIEPELCRPARSPASLPSPTTIT